MKNRLIVIEGTDGSGKKTQSELLVKVLQGMGLSVVRQSYPDYDSPACMPVKMYLNGDLGDIHNLDAFQVNSLYAVDRLCSMQKHNDHIAKGGTIIFDRYVQSTMLHQSALFDTKEQIDGFLQYVDNFEFNVLKLPKPDLVLFLDVPVEISQGLANARDQLKSGNDRDILESDTSHLQKAYNAGKYVAEKFGWNVIDCTQDGKILSIEEIHAKILKVVLG